MSAQRSTRQALLKVSELRFKLRRMINRKSVVALAAAALTISLVAGWRIKERANKRLADERALLEKQNLVPFDQLSYPPIAGTAIAIWQSYQSTRAIARFRESYFVATDGGLVELGPAGNLLRHYTVLDGLPDSDLLSLATFNAKLFIGTRSQGLVTFDGLRFEGYRWTDRASQSIDALLEDAGRLLIGTRAGGLLAFDGRQFKEIRAGAEHKRLLEINLLSKSGTKLFVGTFADGLWIEEGARWSHLTTADGLLSNRIVGVVAGAHDLLVAADYGLASAPLVNLSSATTQPASARFLPLLTLPSLSSMVEYGGGVLLSKDNGEMFSLRTDQAGARQRATPAVWRAAGQTAGCRLVRLVQDLWLLSNDGLQRTQVEASDPGSRRAAITFTPWGQMAAGQSLTTNLSSALAIDSQARLWVGSFRNGIDIMTPSGQRLAHRESETTREINYLTEDQQSKTMFACSSAGLLRFDANFRATERWSTSDGLLSNSVLQVTRWNVDTEAPALLAFATSKGLSLGWRGKLRGITTVQGLPSNSLYSVLVHGRKTYVGTLSGLAVVEDGHVSGVFKDTNSKLAPNWVTALCAIGPRLFVGTYGGGVFELTATGELHGFTSESGRATVNPNAMWSDGSRLYVGTLDGALIFDLYSQRWTRLRSELPARTVLSITGDEKYVYFGTTSGVARVERSYFASAPGSV